MGISDAVQYATFTFFLGIFCGVIVGYWIKICIDRNDPYFDEKQCEKRKARREKEANHD
jgi:hypothetical protein